MTISAAASNGARILYRHHAKAFCAFSASCTVSFDCIQASIGIADLLEATIEEARTPFSANKLSGLFSRPHVTPRRYAKRAYCYSTSASASTSPTPTEPQANIMRKDTLD